MEKRTSTPLSPSQSASARQAALLAAPSPGHAARASLSAEREKTAALETELGSLRAEAEQLKQDSSAAEQRHAEELR